MKLVTTTAVAATLLLPNLPSYPLCCVDAQEIVSNSNYMRSNLRSNLQFRNGGSSTNKDLDLGDVDGSTGTVFDYDVLLDLESAEPPMDSIRQYNYGSFLTKKGAPYNQRRSRSNRSGRKYRRENTDDYYDNYDDNGDINYDDDDDDYSRYRSSRQSSRSRQQQSSSSGKSNHSGSNDRSNNRSGNSGKTYHRQNVDDDYERNRDEGGEDKSFRPCPNDPDRWCGPPFSSENLTGTQNERKVAV